MLDGKEIEVDVHPINTIQKQLYQIYIPIDSKPYRIHMQINEEGAFRIALKDQVPQNIAQLESVLEEAIINS
ncbi:hypothetical protein [Niastella sp. OAS944]